MTYPQHKIEILKQSKKFIAEKETNFLCHAVQSAISPCIDGDQEFGLAKQELLDYIRDALDGSYTLNDWAVQRDLAPQGSKENYALFQLFFRNVRLMWIDWMIYQLTQEIENAELIRTDSSE